MLVDISHHDDKLTINVDIVFDKMPCEILSLDVQDVMGTHNVDIAGNLYKKGLDQDGEPVSVTNALQKANSREQLLQNVKQELD